MRKGKRVKFASKSIFGPFSVTLFILGFVLSLLGGGIVAGSMIAYPLAGIGLLLDEVIAASKKEEKNTWRSLVSFERYTTTFYKLANTLRDGNCKVENLRKSASF